MSSKRAGYGAPVPIMFMPDFSGSEYRHDPKWRKVVATVVTASAIAAGGFLAYENRDLINRQCISAGIGMCAEGALAKKLQTPPEDIVTSVEVKRNGKTVTELGKYSLGASAVKPSQDGTKIYVFPTFSYNPDMLRKVVGTEYKVSANDTSSKPLSDDVVATLGFTDHVNFLMSGTVSSDKKAMEVACITDMSAIVEDAQNHAGWLLGSSTTVTPKDLVGAENVYETRPYKPSGPANDPSVVDVIVAAVLPTSDGKGTIAQVTCGINVTAGTGQSAPVPTATAAATG